jgi:hypothetical protein
VVSGAARVAAAAALALACVGSYGRERLLPRPEPMAVHAGSSLSDDEQRRLADVRRFLGPADQVVLEATLENLAADPRLPRAEGEAALKRALAGYVSPRDFCARLAGELAAWRLRGPLVATPPPVALAIPIEAVHARWLTGEGRRRHPDPAALARAIRDATLDRSLLDAAAPLAPAGEALFVVAASAFEGPGPSAGRRACVGGAPAASYVIARLDPRALGAGLRIPTTADAICREHFAPVPEGASAGRNCAGNAEYATEPVPLAAAAELRLAR